MIEESVFRNVLKTIKELPEYSLDIIDSFSDNQFKAKRKLLELIDTLDILDHNSEIVIWGVWYGSILIPELSKNVKRVTAIDLDDAVIKIAKNKFFKDYSNVDFITDDIFSKFRSRYLNTKLFVNTSCEHMSPMKEWPYWNQLTSDAYFAFQSNNMDTIKDHTNCVYSFEEFRNQLPDNFEVLLQDELTDDRGIRYMLVGKIQNG
jgi:hypothetical protein